MSLASEQAKWAELDGCRLRYEVAGDGPPVVLAHGYGLDRRMWDEAVPGLAAHHTVVRFDFRGFGESEGELDDTYTHGGDLVALLDHLGLERVDLVGLSMGSQASMEVAVLHPERVRRMVLPGPWLADFEFSKDYRDMWTLLASQAQDYGIEVAKEMWRESMLFNLESRSPAAGARLREVMDRWTGWHLAHVAHYPYAKVSERLGEVTAPTLVVLGELDLPDFKGVAARIVERVPGAELVKLPDVGHVPNVEAPEAFGPLVERFLGGA